MNAKGLQRANLDDYDRKIITKGVSATHSSFTPMRNFPEALCFVNRMTVSSWTDNIHPA